MLTDPDEMERLRQMRAQDAARSEKVAVEGGPKTTAQRCAVAFKNKILDFGKTLLKRVDNSRRKWKGANLRAPPRQSLSDGLFSFTGAFLVMLVILKISAEVDDRSSTDSWNFDGGWYSGSLCILFALTPAPVGQPRQIYAAHAWNMLVGIAFQRIPTGGFRHFGEWGDGGNGLPLIWKQALAVGVGVGGQAYFGILHPPATGLSMAFATHSKWSWGTMLSVLFADTVLVVMSMLIINLSEKKQYPLWWLGFWWDDGGTTMECIQSRAKMLATSVNCYLADEIAPKKNKKGDEAV